MINIIFQKIKKLQWFILYRNRFKIIKGVIIFLRSRKHKWYENVVLKEKIKIERTGIWMKIEQKYKHSITVKT